MNIYDLMKQDGVRISKDDRWMVWDGEWIVYERKYRAKMTRVLFRGNSEEVAVRAMLEEE